MANTLNTSTTPSPKSIVENFVHDIRSGKRLDRVADYMAQKVLAHQVHAEGFTTVERSPDDYRQHILEFQHAFGPFKITIQELLADGDRVFVRWRQDGFHNVSLAGEAPSKKPLVEITSTTYRVEKGKIVEYWLQTDRQGIDNQLAEFVVAE